MKALVRTILITGVLALAASPAISQKKKGTPQSRISVTFVSGRSALRIPIEIDNNLILLNASLNGKQPVRLIFDTGASHTVISADRAEQLGIKGSEKMTGNATGGKIEGTMAAGVKIAVTGVEVSDQPVGILAMQRIPGFDFDGVIGFDFINQFVVEIDYLSKVMNLYDPALYRYRGKGKMLQLNLKGRRTPLMNANFLFANGQRVTAKLELDTGGDNAFLLNYPFVTRHRLLKTSKDLVENAGRGAGGETERLLGQAKRAGLGPFLFRDVPVLFSLQKEGLEATVDGIVGGEVLRRFKLIIDYSRRRLILEPNKSLNEPFEVDG